MRELEALDITDLEWLLPLRELARAGIVGGPEDGLFSRTDYGRFAFAWWLVLRGRLHDDDCLIDNETAQQIRAAVMERIGTDANL